MKIELEPYILGDCPFCGKPVIQGDHEYMGLFIGDYAIHKNCMDQNDRYHKLQWIEGFIKALQSKMVKSELPLDRIDDLLEFFKWDNLEFQITRDYPL